ncbi:hypothetical protein ACVGXO_23165, partial [Enterobacter hormaechei]
MAQFVVGSYIFIIDWVLNYKNLAVLDPALQYVADYTAAGCVLFVFCVLKKRGGGSVTRDWVCGFFRRVTATPPPGTTGIRAYRATFSRPYQ